MDRLEIIRKLHSYDYKFRNSLERELYEFIRSDILNSKLEFNKNQGFKGPENFDFLRLFLIFKQQFFYIHKLVYLFLPKLENRNWLFEHPRRATKDVVKYKYPFTYEQKICHINLLNPSKSLENNCYYIDILLVIVKFFSSFLKYFERIKDSSLLEHFGEIDLKFNKAYFRYGKILFLFLMKINRVMNFHFYVSYSKPVICAIAAAKKLNISTAEYQHGMVGRYHPYYSFGYDTMDIVYKPDVFFTYEKKLSIQSKNLLYFNSAITLCQLEVETSITEESSHILYVGQSNIELNLMILELTKEHKLNLFFRPHPNDSFNYDDYSDYLSYEKNIYNDILRSYMVIGINSTVLYQAHIFDRRILIFDLPGHEYMLDFVSEEDIIRIKNIQTPKAKEIIRNKLC